MRNFYIFVISLVGALVLALAIFMIAIGTSDEVSQLSQVKSDRRILPLKFYDRNGEFLAQYGEKRQSSLPFDKFPKKLIDAFLAAEDSRFFEHPGIDITGISRAIVQLLTGSDQQTGGSTITMQLAKNYFLSREKTFSRKFKEIILALKIEKVLTKEEILTIYLNNMFFGFNNYGVVAAAKYYYDKPIDELTIAQYAMIAVLPKAPSVINPLVNAERAMSRRDWIISRMYELGYITRQEYDEALLEPNTAIAGEDTGVANINQYYATEQVRLDLLENSEKYFGQQLTLEDMYSNGYNITLTLGYRLQKIANYRLGEGIFTQGFAENYRKYDLKSIENLPTKTEEIVSELKKNISRQRTSYEHYVTNAVVLRVNADYFDAITKEGKSVRVFLKEIKRFQSVAVSVDATGTEAKQSIKKASDVVEVGNIVMLSRMFTSSTWFLVQVPKVQGAFISIDPATGEILAMVGGLDYTSSNFNRATQSNRQIGSAIKPFFYAYALEHGMTAATMINDAPFVNDASTNNNIWRPFNSSGTFLGPITLRKALTLSRNLVSVRIVNDLGVKRVSDFLEQQLEFPAGSVVRDLTLSVGNVHLPPIKVAESFSIFANGGYLVNSYLLQRIEDKDGNIIWEHMPSPDDTKKRAYEDSTIFIMNSIMQDVMKYGTARRARILGRPDIYGKTGTTNEGKDNWFAGFNYKNAAVVWIGQDDHDKTAPNSSGSSTSLPVWINFMNDALNGLPIRSLVMPDDVVRVQLHKDSLLLMPPEVQEEDTLFTTDSTPDEFSNIGLETRIETKIVEGISVEVINEYFKKGTEPIDTYAATRTSSMQNEEVFIVE